MTVLLRKGLSKEDTVSAGAVIYMLMQESVCVCQERHTSTHTKWNREIFVHPARMLDKVQQKRVNLWKLLMESLHLKFFFFF